ncbi:uncharacterized protein FFB20_11841 [Fusarium fujikuroi]|uniref:Uncharacterized protein n=1 Tax=Gibberella fujikuroi (strain CBS 195.34 / IMI 58289 / NRRL A-6831) TaxID=1279085 RepID=S0E813_GIBF5|nr:uncharacterized protein FFUJ_05856 [Fusarium fujikuroi IMI 58289]KLO97765.1 uncharacterized protein LW94_4915 [Fusarium fujikuroi]KLP00393.1 uncharacterized protein Y057_3497 [Fusarium fujikuroi]QGI65772.1 hypothetical protein CEK27_009743 [Fusarium fujikuroi]QGI83014.1 hypothetical protein CEK25_009743 [Fusarium fujikuroi]QGI96653.1 hypothetical protein CEK26_009722 [Fusarium fujikuroi]
MPLVPSSAPLPSSMTTIAYLREQEILNIVYIGLLVIEVLMVLGVITMALVKRVKVNHQLKTIRSATTSAKYAPYHFAHADTEKTIVALMDHETTVILDSPNIFGDRPKSRCPHCKFYPKHGKNKVCEACESLMGKDEIEAFLGGVERNWCVYHLNRQGFLSGRAALENAMRARLIQEQRCIRLCCAGPKLPIYVHCEDCREMLLCKGVPIAVANRKIYELPHFDAFPDYDDDSFAVRVVKSEASVYEKDWNWDCSLAKFVHPNRKRFAGNISPEEMV